MTCLFFQGLFGSHHQEACGISPTQAGDYGRASSLQPGTEKLQYKERAGKVYAKEEYSQRRGIRLDSRLVAATA